MERWYNKITDWKNDIYGKKKKNENKRYWNQLKKRFTEERPPRKEEPMQGLYDICDVPITQEFVERTSVIISKRKHTEKPEVDPERKKYKVQCVSELARKRKGEY